MSANLPRVLVHGVSLPRKRFLAYDDPAALFRVYRNYECDEEGYPFIWPLISRLIRLYAFNMCEDYGLAYITEGDRLTVDLSIGTKPIADGATYLLYVGSIICNITRPNF